MARPTAAPIPIEVLKPEGEGPFAAVVPMHDCSGLGPRGGASPRRWARKRRGATTEGNAEAWADSLREVRAFFDAHLER